MILSAIVALSIDRQLLKAAAWAFAGALLSAVGLIHAYDLTPDGIQNRFGWMAAPGFAIAYCLTGGVLVALHFSQPPRLRQSRDAFPIERENVATSERAE